MKNGRKWARLLLGAACILLASDAVAEEKAAAAGQGEEAAVIENGKKVSIEYTLSLDDGTKVESNIGDKPLEYEQGAGQIIPGLEEGLAGMKQGDTKKITIPPEKAYGPVHKEAFQEVELTKIPEEARKAGTMLVARDASGNQHQVRIHEMKADKAVIDFNHPLAGKTLTFDVKVVSVH